VAETEWLSGQEVPWMRDGRSLVMYAWYRESGKMPLMLLVNEWERAGLRGIETVELLTAEPSDHMEEEITYRKDDLLDPLFVASLIENGHLRRLGALPTDLTPSGTDRPGVESQPSGGE
jgi:hypothetical protein